jgi:uncharacterized protein YcbX
MAMVAHESEVLGQITEIWRYPVKSVGGQRLETAHLGRAGIDGDRGWGIVDPETGYVLTARRAPRLLFIRADLVDDAPVLVTDDEVRLDSDRALSDWLGRDVRLERAGQVGGTYENPLDIENEADWMTWQGPGGAWHDNVDIQVSLVADGSFGEWDARRFRINLIVAAESDGAWSERQVTIGDAQVRTRRPIDRCVMVTRPQPGIAADLNVLRAIRADSGCLGVGATIEREGQIAVGDVVASTAAR